MTDDGFYKIGTKNGVIEHLFSRNQIALATEEFLREDEIPDQSVSVGTVDSSLSAVAMTRIYRTHLYDAVNNKTFRL